MHHVAVAVGRHWEANPSGTQTAISSDYDANTKRCGVHHSGAARSGRHPRPDGEDETGASSNAAAAAEQRSVAAAGAERTEHADVQERYEDAEREEEEGGGVCACSGGLKLSGRQRARWEGRTAVRGEERVLDVRGGGPDGEDRGEEGVES